MRSGSHATAFQWLSVICSRHELSLIHLDVGQRSRIMSLCLACASRTRDVGHSTGDRSFGIAFAFSSTSQLNWLCLPLVLAPLSVQRRLQSHPLGGLAGYSSIVTLVWVVLTAHQSVDPAHRNLHFASETMQTKRMHRLLSKCDVAKPQKDAILIHAEGQPCDTMWAPTSAGGLSLLLGHHDAHRSTNQQSALATSQSKAACLLGMQR